MTSIKKHMESWGRLDRSPSLIWPLSSSKDWWHLLAAHPEASVLPYGMGRSYGDSCHNHQGLLLPTRSLDKVLAFDRGEGWLTCQAGVSLAEILELVVPAGWFLPVSPGTKYVSLGGAIANDVHGKNHHRRGSFGCHIKEFELLRSTGETLRCSPKENSELFQATIGGLGLTGLITEARLQLIPISSALIDSETIKFSCLEEFFELSEASDKDFEYTVTWIDFMSQDEQLGRGHFIRGNHSLEADPKSLQKSQSSPLISIPFDAPSFLINPLSIKAFNQLYYHRQQGLEHRQRVHFEPFHYPLDRIGHWNRLYGKTGLLQYQFVIPCEAKITLKNIFALIQGSRLGSFLAVLKQFGEIESPGMLSFPQAGYTLTLDFANRGKRTEELFKELDQMVINVGGRLYPAKDARMPAATFQASFPNYQDFAAYIDPRASSDFWRRVKT